MPTVAALHFDLLTESVDTNDIEQHPSQANGVIQKRNASVVFSTTSVCTEPEKLGVTLARLTLPNGPAMKAHSQAQARRRYDTTKPNPKQHTNRHGTLLRHVCQANRAPQAKASIIHQSGITTAR